MTLLETTDRIRDLMPSESFHSLNLLRLAKDAERLEGDIRLDSMERISDILMNNKGFLHYQLEFSIDELRIPVVESQITANVQMKCQRCLEPLIVDIRKKTLLGVVKNKEEFESLPEEYEPFFLEKETFRIKGLIEDELLLAMPFSPSHPKEKCSGTMELTRVNLESKANPFATLAMLKKANH